MKINSISILAAMVLLIQTSAPAQKAVKLSELPPSARAKAQSALLQGAAQAVPYVLEYREENVRRNPTSNALEVIGADTVTSHIESFDDMKYSDRTIVTRKGKTFSRLQLIDSARLETVFTDDVSPDKKVTYPMSAPLWEILVPPASEEETRNFCPNPTKLQMFGVEAIQCQRLIKEKSPNGDFIVKRLETRVPLLGMKLIGYESTAVRDGSSEVMGYSRRIPTRLTIGKPSPDAFMMQGQANRREVAPSELELAWSVALRGDASTCPTCEVSNFSRMDQKYYQAKAAKAADDAKKQQP